MSRDGTADRARRTPTWVPAGSAILGALYVYCGVVVVALLIALLFGVGRVTADDLPTVLVLLLFTTGAALGLRWLARRQRSPGVQAGAVLGAGIMTPVVLFQVVTGSSVTAGVLTILVLGALGVLVGVLPLTENPERGPDERSGVETLWHALPLDQLQPKGERPVGVETADGASRDRARSSADDEDGGARVVGLPRYWVVIGGAFAVCIPIAIPNPELGFGLLSSFLSAYALTNGIDSP